MTHEQELYNHFLKTLNLPNDEAANKTRKMMEMEVNLDKYCMEYKKKVSK
jgi:hypothetical protein